MLIAQDELHTLTGQKAYCEQVLAEEWLVDEAVYTINAEREAGMLDE